MGTLPWLLILGIAAAVAVAAWLHHLFWVRRLGVPMEYAELHRVDTPDGSAIELRRLSPPRRPGLPPVLLVHGLATSHRNHDIDPERSLARHLEAAGRDVWLVTLRSGRRDLTRAEARSVRFSTMARHDVPAAVEHVLERTRARRLDYVGFSMGGMLLYASLGHTVPRERIRRVAAIGSPGRIESPWPWLRVFRRLPRWLVPNLWLRLLARLFAFAVDWLPTPLHGAIYNRRNVAPGVVPRAMVNVIADVPGALQWDFAEWALGDGEVVVDDEPLLESLRDLDVPAIFLAGAGDRLAPPAAVRLAYEAWGSNVDGVDKTFRVLGKETGAAEDYGHGDLVIGRVVREEVFEPVAAFLAHP